MTRTPAEHVGAAFGRPSAFYLGSGTYGETWQLDGLLVDGTPSSCAVKLLHPHTLDKRLVDREVDGLREFDDRRIVRLLEVRTVHLGGVERVALICEYVPGGHVAQNHRTRAPSAREIQQFAVELLAAVRILHKNGRVHRDIKPENIILRRGQWNSPVLIDFGLSKSSTDATFTQYPQRVGSLAYMAPEVLAGAQPRNAADLWACGVVLYAVLTGKHPYVDDFAGLHPDEVAELITGPPRPLPGSTSPTLEEVILRLLSEEPHERGSARRAYKDLRKAYA